LSKLPEYRRQFADRAIKKILNKYYGELESKIEPMAHVLLEALERSDYRTLLEHIAESKPRDIAAIADDLADFGLVEMACLVEQAQARSVFLDQLETLATAPRTTEATIHKALENNLWVFGPEYSLFSSNITLRRQIEDYLGTQYVGNKSDQRPDLLLNENLRLWVKIQEWLNPRYFPVAFDLAEVNVTVRLSTWASMCFLRPVLHWLM
jgi:hypothetical protein